MKIILIIGHTYDALPTFVILNKNIFGLFVPDAVPLLETNESDKLLSNIPFGLGKMLPTVVPFHG